MTIALVVCAHEYTQHIHCSMQSQRGLDIMCLAMYLCTYKERSSEVPIRKISPNNTATVQYIYMYNYVHNYM